MRSPQTHGSNADTNNRSLTGHWVHAAPLSSARFLRHSSCVALAKINKKHVGVFLRARPFLSTERVRGAD